MKTTTLLLATIIFVLVSCEKPAPNYDWKDISVHSKTGLTTMYMLDDEVGYVGGRSFIEISKTVRNLGYLSLGDTLIYTPDNGVVYTEYEFKEDQDPAPVLYKTSNGGLSWQAIETPFIIGVEDMQFINEMVGYVASEGEGVYKTTDGGETWTKLLENMVHYYYNLETLWDPFTRVLFIDENKGFAYGEDILFSTSDGGESWDCLSLDYAYESGQYPTIFKNLEKLIFFNSCDTGYAVSNNNLYRTVDLGKNWEIVYSEKRLWYEDVYFTSPQVGYLTSKQLATNDGGATWSKDELGLRGDNVVLIGRDEFYYTNDSHIIYKKVAEPELYFMTTEVSPYLFKKLIFTSDNVGYALGIGSTILKYVRE